jgi:biotin carboxylase
LKSILIIGAGFLQAFVIQKAKDLGYHTFAIDKDPCAVGFSIADECSAVDIVDLESCLNYARAHQVDGVMTAATDYGVLSTAYVARELGLQGLDYEAAKTVKNKFLVRNILDSQTGEGISQFFEICQPNELSAIREKIQFPVIVKPCDGSGSKAVNKACEFKGLMTAVAEALNASRIRKALVETFIAGREYGVESMVLDGEVYVLGIMGKHMTDPPDYAELGHYMPSELPIEYKVREVVQKAIKALGINYGAVNMDVLITERGEVFIVDVGARMGGNLIGSHIIPIGTGVDYMEALIRSAVGDAAALHSNNGSEIVATRLLALKPGNVKSLPDFSHIQQLENVEIYHHLHTGDKINRYHNNLDGCGYVLARGDSLDEAERRAETAKNLIDEGIVGE